MYFDYKITKIVPEYGAYGLTYCVYYKTKFLWWDRWKFVDHFYQRSHAEFVAKRMEGKI